MDSTTSHGAPKGYRFAPLRPGQGYFDDAVRLYAAIWGGDTGEIISFFSRYAGYPDYRGLVAVSERDGTLAGFGFGTRSFTGNWWHDRVAAQVGADHPALREAWTLVNLAVAQEHRGRGVGTALMETLLASQPCPRALLSTQVANAGARRLYERYGWSYLHDGFAFTEGQEPYVVMRRELRAK